MSCDYKNKLVCRFDWGRSGVERAATRGDIIIVVDTLSFSTAVIAAVDKGAIVLPCREEDDAQEIALREDAEVAVRRRDVPRLGRYSLSPLTYADMEPGTRLVLPSLNGATCVRVVRQSSSTILIGALINAKAAARKASQATPSEGGLPRITVVACGERFKTPNDDGSIRFAVEDYLGAGAVLSYLTIDKTPEAVVCENAFSSCRNRLDETIWECESGIELREVGFGDDVVFASQLNRSETVPILRGGFLTA